MKNPINQPIVNQHKELKYPVFVQLELTERCNHFCKHCYNYWNYFNTTKKNDIDINLLKRVLIKLEENKVFDLTITGGEPFMHSKAIDFILENRGEVFTYDTGINTNLSILPKDCHKLKGSTILFSYPAYSKETWKKIVGVDDQKMVLKNLEKIISFVPAQANMAVSKLNLNEIFKAGEFLYKNFGLNKFAATPASPVKGVDDHKQITLSKKEVLLSLEQLRELKKSYDLEVDVLETIPLCLLIENKENYIFFGRGCSAGKTTITVSATGNVRPCSRASQEYGNILHDDLAKIWKDMNSWRSGHILPSECKSCEAVNLCSGGCRVNGEAYEGSIKGKDLWMGKKINNTKIEEIVKAFNKKNPKIDLNKRFRIKEGFKFRREGEDAEVIYCDGNFLLVNNSLANFLKYNQGKVLNLSKRDIDIGNKLYYSKFIEEV